jgi:hypothetical protein
VIRSGLYLAVSKICFAAITALLFALPLEAQVRRGSLVVWIVSKQADYVVIGADSRTLNLDSKSTNDSGCKILSLGGDTLFYETGTAGVGGYGGKSWTAATTARNVYKSSLKRDALSLATEWRGRTLRWFDSLPDEEVRSHAQKMNGNLVSDGFINFGPDGSLSIHSVAIVYDARRRRLDVQSTSQGPGETGISGVALNLVAEFLQEKTDRAVKAFGPVGTLRFARGVNQSADVDLIQKAIKFAMDNSVGEDKLALGGDIDVAIIRKDHTIQWVARKPVCNQQDLKATPL